MLAPTAAAVHDVPLFLDEATDSILMTGKYLNAIRECGRPVERPLPPDMHIGTATCASTYASVSAVIYTSPCFILYTSTNASAYAYVSSPKSS